MSKKTQPKATTINFINYTAFSVAVIIILWAVASTVKSNPETQSFQESMTAIPSNGFAENKTTNSPDPTSSPSAVKPSLKTNSSDNLGQTIIPLGNSSVQKPSDIQGSGITVNPTNLQGNNSNPQSALQVKPGELNTLEIK